MVMHEHPDCSHLENDEIIARILQEDFMHHKPRINREIPSIDEATSDHQRLLDRLQLYEFVERKIQGDGNCQFCALSDQLYYTPDHHKSVRQQVVSQLRSRPEIYEGYVPMQYEDYLEKMSESGEWGDHVTLQAAADLLFSLVFGQRCITTRSIVREVILKEKEEKVVDVQVTVAVNVTVAA
ncbi:otu domain-containing protein [Fagus crenata]